jgi:tRNA (cmo5U34)-methyltransferase
VDFSAPMLQRARAGLRGYGSRVHFVTADLGSANWVGTVAGRAPFEAVVSGFAIHHLTDRRKRGLYGEIFQLLKPGGLFVNTEHVASSTPWVEDLCNRLVVDSLYRFHRSRGSPKSRARIEAEFVHRPDKAANILAPLEQQCRWLREWGFEDVDCYFKAFEIAVFGGRRGKG